MDKITCIFTKRPFNPVSVAIRCAIPVSLFKMAEASHCLIRHAGSGFIYEAGMASGCRRVTEEEANKGAIIVATRTYDVPNANAGYGWFQQMVDKKVPYDWKGAFGLGIAPDRNWQDESAMFCFEYLATGLAKAGRSTFTNASHVTGTMLMALEPTLPVKF